MRVGVRGQSVRITDKDGESVRDLPLANIESLAVVGGVQVSTQALTVFASHEIPVAFLTSAGRLVAMMDPMGPTSAAVRAAQVRRLDRPDVALELARAVTVAKFANQRTLLMRNHIDLPQRVAPDLAEAIAHADKARTLNELRGHEGERRGDLLPELPRHVQGGRGPHRGAVRRQRPAPPPASGIRSTPCCRSATRC